MTRPVSRFFDPFRGRRAEVSPLRTVIGLFFLAIVLVVLYLVETRQVASFEIISDSMEPALLVGDKWLMEPPAGRLKIGDMVVFHFPAEPDRMIVKRVVAQEADHVQINGGVLYVNGAPAPPPHGREIPTVDPNEEWTVGPGQLFVAGDNRLASVDSREYGPIPAENVVGVITRPLIE